MCGQKWEGKMREENEVTLKKNQVTWKKKIVGKSAKVRWEKRIRWHWKKKKLPSGREYFCKTVIQYFWQHFSLLLFLPIWEDQNFGPRRENCHPGFLSFAFSFPSQIVENSIFHPIFLPLFSPNQTQPKDNPNLYWVITHKTLNWSISIFF